MKKDEEIKEIYTSKEKIDEIIEKLKGHSFNNLQKTNHYKFSVMEKNTDEDFLDKKFQEFENIELISFRSRENNLSNYDIYYRNEDGTYTLFAIDLNKTPIILNAYKVNRNFDKFKEQLIKNYGDKLV